MDMHPTFRRVFATLLVIGAVSVPLVALDYPLGIVADATLKTGPATTINSVVTIKLDRLMEESRRKRVVDALRYNGYAASLNVLRELPPIGTIAAGAARAVEIRFAAETEVDGGRRLVIVADKPLFFLNTQTEKSRAGYELTVVELLFDKSGRATGTMSGAARVKPAGDGDVTMTDFADTQVQLTARPNPR